MILSNPRSPQAPATAQLNPAQGFAFPWIVRLRYGMIVGEIVTAGAVSLGLNIPLPYMALGLPIAVQLLTNLVLARRQRNETHSEHWIGPLFCLDTLCLTIVLAATGGPSNPFSLLYLVQITFSAVILQRAWTWALGVLSTIAFGLLFWISTDIPALHIHVPAGESSLHLLGMWVAFGAAALLISFFIGKVSAEARQKEREILTMEKRLARNERLASLVTLAAGAAHEMATPLSTIAVTAKEIEHDARRRLQDPRVEEDALLIRSQVERCRLILERMGSQGADPFGEAPRTLDLRSLYERVKHKFPQDVDRILIDVPDGAPRCSLPENAAVEALSALVKNALDASSENQPVVMTVVTAGDSIRLQIRDRGTGMTPEILDRVLEPFFTTKPAGKGMGLGAFLAHLFAQRLGGKLQFESRPGEGCTASIELPVPSYVRG